MIEFRHDTDTDTHTDMNTVMDTDTGTDAGTDTDTASFNNASTRVKKSNKDKDAPFFYTERKFTRKTADRRCEIRIK